MDIIDTNSIEVIDIDKDVYTLQNKKNNKIVKLNKEQLKGIQENNIILDALQESGFFSQRVDAPLFSKHKNNFFDYQKVKGFKENGIGILGLPFDACSTGLTGSSNSPNVLRRLTSGYMTKSMDIMLTEREYNLLDPVYSVNIYDCGDILYIPGESGDSFHKRIEKAIDYLKEKHGIRKFVSVGGDHSCTLPLIKSLDIENIVFIKFDAHFDNNIKKDYENINHANFVCEINKMKNIKKIFHIGVRENLFNKVLNEKDVVVSPDQINTFNLIDSIKELGNNIYISIDFDVIDPVQFNSTGFLVPFGLQIEQILFYIEKLKQFNIVGIDLMEFNSSLDSQKKDQYICTNILRKCIELIGGI